MELLGLAMQAPFKMDTWKANWKQKVAEAHAKAREEGHEAAEEYDKYMRDNADEL